MKALVTGGGGFLGQYIVEQLLHEGAHVRIFSRQRYPELEALGVETSLGDLKDAPAVTVACQGMDTVFHVAAVPGIWGSWKTYYETNTLGTENVLAGCRTHGVRRLIYTSSPSVIYDGRAHEGETERLPYPAKYQAHYPHSKALAEQAVLAANEINGLRTIALRPHLIWGPRDRHLLPRLIQRARAGRLVRVGNGENQISMSYVENTAAAHLQAAHALESNSKCAGRAYFINEPEPVRLWEWVNQLLTIAGLPPVQRGIPYSVAYAAGALLETVYKLSGRKSEPPMTRFLAAQLAKSHWYRVDAAIADFSYRPIVTFEEAMQRVTPDLRRWAATS
jgi:nucleoside-diphosphate-sugar epimerase